MGRKESFYVDIMALNQGVTGSCNLVIVKLPDYMHTRVRFVVDCGLFQEKDADELNQILPFNPEKLNFCMVTHNHVDHIGRLPYMVRRGFRGKIFTTEPTEKLMRLALWDCHKVLKGVSKRKHTRQLYRSDDVQQTLNLVQPCKYGEELQVHENIYVTFLKNGHLVGASIIFVRITYPGYEDINLLFTGDYKSENTFLDVESIPTRIQELPITIIQESTYGQMKREEMTPCFKENLLKQVQSGGTVLAPVFSLGRSQEILYELKVLQDEGKLSCDIPIFLDGKLAQQYTNLYTMGYLNVKETMRNFLPKNFTMVDKASRAKILESTDCKIILTTSGMGSYGPAQTYLAHYVKQADVLIHFTGYTAEGTLGARLKNTPLGESVEIGGIVTKKLARVEYTTEYSAHAKADEMLEFLSQFKKLKLVLVNHGEEEVKESFARLILNEINPKDVGILGKNYFFRVCPFGLVRTLSTKFR